MEAITVLLLLHVIFGSPRLYSRQALLFLIAILIPVIVDALFTFGISPVQGYNMAPSTFAFTGILLAITLFEYRFIDIVPIARTALFEQMGDPMLVIDPDGRLADFNPAAERLFKLDRSTGVGRVATECLQQYEELRVHLGQPGPQPGIIAVGSGPNRRLFEVSVGEILSGRRVQAAKMVVLRDITDRSRVEERAVHLASFPELTPVIILEADVNGAVVYANPACITSLKAIGKIDPRIFIPADIRDRLDGRAIPTSLHEEREIEIGDQVFRENVYFTPEFSSVRIYANDITGRKRAEEALRESKDQFILALDVWNTGVWEWDIETNELRFDARFHTMLGYTPGDLPFALQEWMSYHHPGDIQLWIPKAEAYIRGDSPVYESEHRIRTRDGDWAWVFTRGKIIKRTPAGSPKLFMGIAINVSETRQAEAELAVAQQRYCELFEGVNIGIIRSTPGPEGAIIEVNPAAVRIFEVDDREQLLTVSPVDLYADAGERRRISDEVQAKGFIRMMEVRYRTLRGKSIWARIGSTKKISGDGQVYFDNTIEDITEYKRAAEALYESEQKYHRIVETAEEGIWQLDENFCVIYANPRMAKLLGYTAQEMMGRKSSFFMPGSELADDAVRTTTQRNGGSDHFERQF